MKITKTTAFTVPRTPQLNLPCYLCPRYPLNSGLTFATCSCDRAYDTTYSRQVQNTVEGIDNWGSTNVTLPW